MNKNGNVILEKSKNFAIRVIRLFQYLQKEKEEFILSKQLLRSGTSIGANVREAHSSMSKAEFKAKLNIALKEASETKYWLRLLRATDYLTEKEQKSIFEDCIELEKMLTSIVKTTSENIK